MMKLFLRVTLVAALVPLSVGALAKGPPKQSPLVGALAACQAIADNTQRLACFDKAAGNLVVAAGKGDVSVVDRAELREARRSLFGFSMPKLPFFSGDDSAGDVSDTLDTTIKSASGIGYGKFRIVVAQGDAVWETTEAFATMRDPKVGQKITIKRGPLGSYMIKINNQRAVKGRRVG
jgi:hypothetical protein